MDGPPSASLAQCFVKGSLYLIKTIFLSPQRKKDGKTKKIRPETNKQQNMLGGGK